MDKVLYFTLTFDPATLKQEDSSFYHQQFTCEVWKRVVCIVPIRFYEQSAKIDLDLYPVAKNQ